MAPLRAQMARRLWDQDLGPAPPLHGALPPRWRIRVAVLVLTQDDAEAGPASPAATHNPSIFSTPTPNHLHPCPAPWGWAVGGGPLPRHATILPLTPPSLPRPGSSWGRSGAGTAAFVGQPRRRRGRRGRRRSPAAVSLGGRPLEAPSAKAGAPQFEAARGPGRPGTVSQICSMFDFPTPIKICFGAGHHWLAWPIFDKNQVIHIITDFHALIEEFEIHNGPAAGRQGFARGPVLGCVGWGPARRPVLAPVHGRGQRRRIARVRRKVDRNLVVRGVGGAGRAEIVSFLFSNIDF